MNLIDTKMPKGVLLNTLSYLDANDICSFKRCNKENYKFHDRYKYIINFKFFLEKISQDHAAWICLNKTAKKDPLLKSALIAFTNNGEILKREGGYPILLDRNLMDQYLQFAKVKKNVNDQRHVERKFHIDNGYCSRIGKINEGCIYTVSNSIKFFDTKNSTFTELEGSDTFISSRCRWDKINNQLWASNGHHLLNWDLSNGKILKICEDFYEGCHGNSDAILLDKEKIYAGNDKGEVIVLNKGTGKVLSVFQAHEKGIRHLEKSGNYIISFSKKNIKFWTSKEVIFLDEIPSQKNLLEFDCVNEISANLGSMGKMDFDNFKIISEKFMFLKTYDKTLGESYTSIIDISNIKNIKNVCTLKERCEKIKILGNSMFMLSFYNTTVWDIENINNEKISSDLIIDRLNPGRVKFIKEYTGRDNVLLNLKENHLAFTEGNYDYVKPNELVVRNYSPEQK